jgi:hypothetical protein
LDYFLLSYWADGMKFRRRLVAGAVLALAINGQARAITVDANPLSSFADS